MAPTKPAASSKKPGGTLDGRPDSPPRPASPPVIKDGRVATEPPFSDGEVHRMAEVMGTLYGPMGAHARSVRIHNGPLTLRSSLPAPAERTQWVRDNKQFNPYITFSNETPPEEKSTTNHKLWMPRVLHEPKKKGKKNSGPKYTYTDGDLKKSAKDLAARPRWDTEHNVMVSQMNPEVQSLCREYFDKPIRKESEGIPKVKELYTMNDRQTGWWDEPSPLGEPKHTYLDNCAPWNVGGPKVAQKVSYWRTALEKSASEPVIKASIKDSRSHLTLIERTADMTAAQSTQFWREWSEQSKKRLPDAPQDLGYGKKKKGQKRGGWPSPSQSDDAAHLSSSMPSMRTGGSTKKGRDDWNSRCHVTVSKDNPNLCMGHRQFFSSAQFLSGAEVGHPGAYLGLASQKWRDAAVNVTLCPTGAAGRGPIGRRCMLY